MPEWRAYVREHLAGVSIADEQREEIVGELAGHLEECYTAYRAGGMNEGQAVEAAHELVGSWEELRWGIASARLEGSMSDRVKQIWLPGLVTLLSSYTVLALLQWAGVQPFFFRPAPGRIVFFYTPWLVILIFIGAVGGFLSRRAMARGWRIYVSAALPSLLMAGLFAVIFPLAFINDPKVNLELKLTTLSALVVSWVILPGFALCAGAALQNLRRIRREI